MNSEKIKTRFAQIRERMLAQRSAHEAVRSVLREPVYDEVYFKGMEWLDSLAETDDWDFIQEYEAPPSD